VLQGVLPRGPVACGDWAQGVLTDSAAPTQIFETEHALAFLDAFPMAEARLNALLCLQALKPRVCAESWLSRSFSSQGHSLLIPKATGYADIYDMPPDVAASVLRELPRLAKAVQAATGCEGVNIVQNNGKAAGQVVFHLHFHVIPRMAGDGLIKLGAHGASGGMIDPQVAARVGDAIRAAL
jgi:histidine triad (HIT) family protein